MQVAIDIPEEIYKGLFDDGEMTGGECAHLLSAVKNGTVLPRGHWNKRHYINGDKQLTMYCCSNCGEEFSYDAETGSGIEDYDYCPNCRSVNHTKINYPEARHGH